MQLIRHPLITNLWLALAAIVLSVGTICAQDPSFSQFYANRVYLNPGFVGLESGLTVSGVSRIQWLNVDRGFKTYGFTLETQLPHVRLGLGLHVLSNTEGIGNLSTNQGGLVLSYTIPGERDNIHFGMEARLVQKSIDWDQLIFSDQIDPIYGVVNATNLIPAHDNVLYGDFDFGVVWRHVSKQLVRSKSIQRIRSQLGVSFHHLPYLISNSAKGNDSFLNRDTRIAPRTTIHGGLIIPITFLNSSALDIAISPNIKLDMQGYQFMSFRENLVVGTVGFYTGVSFVSASLYTLISNFYTGILYQNRTFAPNAIHTDAFILTVGAYTNLGKSNNKQQSPALFFGISADLNATGVGPAAGSVFEFTFRYRFLTNANFFSGPKKGRGKRNRVLDCKSFF